MSAVGIPLPGIKVDPLIPEARQRARRRRLIAAAALLLAAGVTAAGVLSFGAGGSSGEIPWLPTRPQLPAANPPLAPPCTASQLSASLSLGGATMSWAGPISIVNRSTRPCSLLGRPKLSFANATSKWQETRVHGGPVIPFDPLAPPRGTLRAVAPDEHVSVQLWWSNWCGRGAKPGGSLTQSPSAIVLSPPGGGQIRLTNAHTGHGLPAPVCNGGPGSVSMLGASGFTPFVPQGPPSSALPLKASIVSGGPVTIKGKTLSQPSFVAKAGSWLSYTVVLRNTSAKPYRFGHTCPAYVEDWGGFARAQAYVLNCHPVGSIAPRQSAKFAMRIYVPKIALSAPAFGWTLAPHTYNAPTAMGVVQIP